MPLPYYWGMNPDVYPELTASVPTMDELPEYEAPEWDEERIRALTQTQAAPGLRNLRQQMARAYTLPSTNPNIKAMNLREALAGYGSGLESIMSGARRGAGEEYAREYETEATEGRLNYEAQLKKLFAEYQASYADYMAKEARKPVYGGVSGSSSTYRSSTPSISMVSDYGKKTSTPTQTVDLLGDIGDEGGYEPSYYGGTIESLPSSDIWTNFTNDYGNIDAQDEDIGDLIYDPFAQEYT